MAEGANYEYLMKQSATAGILRLSAIRWVFASKSIASSVRPTQLYSSLDKGSIYDRRSSTMS